MKQREIRDDRSHNPSIPSKKFFSEIDAGRFTIVTSAIVEAVIEPAPQKIRDFFDHYEAIAEIAQVTQEMLLLQQQYIKSGVVTQNPPKMLCMSQLPQ